MGPNGRIDDPPSGQIGLYEEAFQTRIRLPSHPFIVKIFCFFDISLCSIIPNSFCFIFGFVAICIMAKVQPSISIIQSFCTIKRCSGDWWYVFPQRGVPTLIKRAPFSIHDRRADFYSFRALPLRTGGFRIEVSREILFFRFWSWEGDLEHSKILWSYKNFSSKVITIGADSLQYWPQSYRPSRWESFDCSSNIHYLLFFSFSIFLVLIYLN